jgi:TolB-like protein/Tfp pilus assembly protein PilF
MSLSAGSRVGSYQIVGSLGAGGMGEVYRAHDPRLGRYVALKVLPRETASDPARLERFAREARAIAALNHPHIVTIYSTEEADGIRFLTMELVEGHTLDALIPPAGLPLSRFVDLALPLADALTAAHQKQITHRDLKPANVMVTTDDRVKVLDFGLARVTTAVPTQTVEATRPVLTSEGTIVGTMPYMSPEQIEGRTLDHRTDLFSLGVMFHEMLTGSRPFTGPSSPQLMSSILRDVPESASSIRADVPESLSRLIHRCLEKRPDDRVQTARDVYNELKHVQKQLESDSSRRKVDSGSVRSAVAESLWIAVLPFTTRTTDPDSVALADGLTEDITAGLSLFPSLSVVALQTARSFKDSPLDARQIAERLNARYIMYGSVRKSASGIRIAIHLIDAGTNVQLWSETIDQRLDGIDIYAVQDDVTDRIVSTVADKAGVLARSMAQSTQGLPIDRLSANQLVHRSWAFEARPTPGDHAALRTAAEAMLERQPHHAELWAELGSIYVAEHCLFYNPLPDSLLRGLRAARRAVEIDRTNQRGWVVLASAFFFQRDDTGFQEAADKVLALNPRNSNAIAWIGAFTTHKGDYDRGASLMDRAMALNPVHPGWYHFVLFNRYFARREFDEALRAARRVNIPDFMWMHLAIAGAAGQLGLAAEGKAALKTMETLVPALADERNLRELLNRWYWDEAVVEGMVEGVQRLKQSSPHTGDTSALHARPPSATKAQSSAASDRSSAAKPSGASSDRARDAGALAITVRMFTARGGDTATELAEGLSEDVTTGLSRFSYLRVVPRESAEGTSASIARYVLEGQVRRASSTVRVTARLIDTRSGAQLWAENYDRPAESEIFQLQDDIASRIVATVADANGVMLRSMVATLRQRPIAAHSVSDLVIRFHGFMEHFDPAEHRELRDGLIAALKDDPNHGDGWGCLSSLIQHEHAHGLNTQADSLKRALEAAERSVALNPVCQEGWRAMANVAYFTRDAAGVRIAAERAITINPLNTGTVAVCGMFLAYSGAWDRGLEVLRQAMQPNPHYPGWLHFPFFSYHYNREEYAEALTHVKPINMPRFPKWHLTMAAVAGRLGMREEARGALEALRRLDPTAGDDDYVRTTFASWIWTDDEMERLVTGVRMARALTASGTAPRQATPAGANPTLAATRASIAVLPFADLSADKNQDWFCDGIAEEILNALAQLPDLHVAARTSTFSLRNSAHDLRTVGEKLDVETVVEGSVRRAGDRIRVTVQLVDVANGFQLWSDRYDREMKDIFDVQDEIARAVANRLKVALPDGRGKRMVSATTANLEAYELYLQGRALLYRRGASIQPALECFRRVVELDADYAPAWAGIADAYVVCGYFGLVRGTEVRRQGLAAARRALALDPTSADAHTAFAALQIICENDIEAAGAAFRKALELNPLHMQARCWYSLFYLQAGLGRYEDGIVEARRAQEMDPLSAYAATILAVALITGGRTADAVEEARRAVGIDPQSFLAQWSLALAFLYNGQWDEAVAACERAAAMSNGHHFATATLAMALAKKGNVDRARTLHSELATRAAKGYIPLTQLTITAFAAGDCELALAYAQQALEEREPPFLLMSRHWPDFADLRKDPRFAAIVRHLDEPLQSANAAPD